MSESGGLKLGKGRLTQAEMDAIQGGERLQDVHMAAVNHLLQLQFPEKAGFQSTSYICQQWSSKDTEERNCANIL